MADSPENIAWVTGAGKGIGRALARQMAREGWTVAVSARTAEDLSTLAAECPPGRIHIFPLDITDAAATEKTVGRIESELGAPDLVVLNAGTHQPMAAADFSADTFQRLMETNFMGTVNGMAAIIPGFIDRGKGHIAVVASLAGYRGLPTAAAYGASKAALINMCEALRPDLARHGVRLTLVNPGFVQTPLTDKNKFAMPFLMGVEEAAKQMLRGLEGSAFEVTFPWRFAVVMKFLRLLPDRLFFALTRRMIGK
jgi:NAD(P)-dependent dehydrogenase (short-subunit alcohol dehydrogenase family)